MSTALSSPVTGSAQTAFTSPTYTLSADTAPTPNGRQYAVTTLGGTQSGVSVHSPSKPFTINIVRPAVYKLPAAANAATGLASTFPRNTWKVIVRKGANVDGNGYNQPQAIVATIEIAIPAGVEAAAPAEVRAMLSLLIGSLTQFSASFGDSLVTGVA